MTPHFTASDLSIIVLFSILLTIIFLSIVILGPDNKIEEAFEDYIEHKTGIEIDVSP